MPKQHITIRDVAKAAGVSTQTVSRVINNRPDVASHTRTHVQSVIQKLGYAPNVLARSLSRGRSSTLGVIGYGLEYYGSTSVLRGVERKANQLGYSLLLALIDRIEPDRVDHVVSELLSHQVAGLIWTVPGNINTFDWLSEKFSRINTPLIHLNRSESSTNLVVAMDNRLGGELAAQHLLDQGYQRVGIITGPSRWWEAVEREAGWRAVMQQNTDLDLSTFKVEGDWNAASGDVGLQTLLDQCPDLDAVFVSNDQMALGVLQAAHRLGIHVPRELGIVGFDDIPESAYFYPPISTVRQNATALGAQAVEIICQQIQCQGNAVAEPIPPGITWVRPRLVVRQSSSKT